MPGIGPVPVLNAGFTQIGLSAFTMHDQAVPPVPPVPNVPGLIEGPAFMGWPPGALSHKVAYTVLSDGNPTVQHGHDIGYVIPHFALPMNSLCALHTMLSKHKVPFPVNQVHVGGKPAGTYVWFLMGEICANPVSMPSAVVILLKCTVWTSMSWTDLLIGLAVCAMDALLDLVWNKLKRKPWFPRLPGDKTSQVLGGFESIGEIVAMGGARIMLGYVLKEIPNKVFQHVLKSWIVSPMVTGLPFGKSGIGRGNWAFHSFFGSSNRSDAHH
jgi:hypothetical protein